MVQQPVRQVSVREPRLRGEVLGREALPLLMPAWEDLCQRGLEDNVYYAPRYARALLDHVDADTSVRFAVVWDEGKLVALLPVAIPKVPVPVMRPAGQAWQSKFTFSCTPLLDSDRPVEGANALLDVMASVSRGEWVIRRMNIEGPVCAAMISALARRRQPWTFLHRFRRAILEPRGTFDEYTRAHVPAKRRNDLGRNRRRLEKLGKVEHESYSSGQGLARAMASFLEIEAAGWKGQQGTALACNERTRRFALDAFTEEKGASICRADVLTLAGRPIAVGLIVFAGRTGFTVKGAYDETYRTYSPGLLLEVEVIRSLLSGTWADRLDAGTSGAHVIDSLWSGRIEVADLMFSLAPTAAHLRLSALRISDQIHRDLRTRIKPWHTHLIATFRAAQ